jgi:tetratricopeptide (TPR) repeat protein
MGWWHKWLGGSEGTGESARKSGGAFLAVLGAKGKCAVSNLNPFLYQVIIKEKKGDEAPAIVSLDETDLNLVRKLPIGDIEILCQSVREAQQGDAAASRGDMPTAARQYRKAFELNPYNDLTLMSYGVVLARQGNLREGIQWVEKAVRVNPDNERAKRNLKGMKADL